jgi:hypothetical protein
VWSNLGEVENKGFEVSLNAEVLKSNDFNWNSSLIFYFNRNKINRLYGNMIDVKDANGNIIGQKEADDKTSGYYIGHPLDAIYDYNVLGVYQLSDEAEAAKYGKKPGDFKLQDVNDDGKLLPDDDKVFLGQTTPKYRLNFNNTLEYKNIELSFMLSGMFGFKNQVANLHQWDHFSVGRTNHYDLPYWTPENPINDYARLFSSAASPSFRYWDNNSFIRIESLTLGYDIPGELLAPLEINSAKLFLNGTNLLTITDWIFFDPETMTWTPRVITLGINISL